MPNAPQTASLYAELVQESQSFDEARTKCKREKVLTLYQALEKYWQVHPYSDELALCAGFISSNSTQKAIKSETEHQKCKKKETETAVKQLVSASENIRARSAR
jgi:hypothetical protein